MKFLKFNEIDSTNDYMKRNISSFENYDIVSAKSKPLVEVEEVMFGYHQREWHFLASC